MTTSPSTSTLSRFPAAAADFVRDLYVEHLEEASFLYDQRNYILEHVEMEHHDITWNEQRCDRHLDALVAGGDLTLALCRERAVSGEERGDLYATMRVFCRADRPDLVKSVLDELDTEDAEVMGAARDGLKHELPQSWSARVSQWLDGADEARAAILAVASAYRRLDVGPAVVLCASGSLDAPVPFLWALGRLREPTASMLFQRYIRDGDDDQREAAALGALRLGDEALTDMLREAVARGECWAALPLALVGHLSDFTALKRLGSTSGPQAEVALAMGLLGHLGAVDTLLDWLGPDGVAEAAATALHLLTGSYPLDRAEEVVESIEDRDEDEDADHPQESPQHQVLARSRAAWEASCRELRPKLQQDVRILFGTADLTPTLRGLTSPALPVRVRDLLGDALVVRHAACASPSDGWGQILLT